MSAQKSAGAMSVQKENETEQVNEKQLASAQVNEIG